MAKKIGRFERAQGGTVFLDEIGELPLEVQPKLLRVLQEQEFERVGGARTIWTDVRIIAATNRYLLAASQAGQFLPDLYYRLDVFPIPLPALRERSEDIPSLIQYFVKKYAAQVGKPITAVSSAFVRQCLACS